MPSSIECRMREPVKPAIAIVVLVLAAWTVRAQQAATADELKQAEQDVPKLMPVLELRPGMTVADVGAGAGAMTLVMAQALGPPVAFCDRRQRRPDRRDPRSSQGATPRKRRRNRRHANLDESAGSLLRRDLRSRRVSPLH